MLSDDQRKRLNIPAGAPVFLRFEGPDDRGVYDVHVYTRGFLGRLRYRGWTTWSQARAEAQRIRDNISRRLFGN